MNITLELKEGKQSKQIKVGDSVVTIFMDVTTCIVPKFRVGQIVEIKSQDITGAPNWYTKLVSMEFRCGQWYYNDARIRSFTEDRMIPITMAEV